MDKKNIENFYKNLESFSLEFKNEKIIYNGKEFSENDFLKKACSFSVFNEKQISVKNNAIIELPSTIQKLFLRNVYKMSILGLFFPCTLFLLVSFITFSLGAFLQNNANFANFAKMSYVLSFFFILVFLILLVKIFCGEKVFVEEKYGKKRLTHISKKKYQEMMQVFKSNIFNEHYYFNDLKSVSKNHELTIREFRYNDVKTIYNLFKNANVCKYLIAKEFRCENEAYEFVKKCVNDYKNKQIFKLGIEINGHLIGYIGLSTQDLSKNTCQIIYAIGEEYWGNGYVCEAISLFIPYLKKKGKNIIYAGHVDENYASKRVLEKSGFVRFEAKDYVLDIHGVPKQIVSYIYGECLENTDESKNV